MGNKNKKINLNDVEIPNLPWTITYQHKKTGSLVTVNISVPYGASTHDYLDMCARPYLTNSSEYNFYSAVRNV